jgi:hypothetical protein
MNIVHNLSQVFESKAQKVPPTVILALSICCEEGILNIS